MSDANVTVFSSIPVKNMTATVTAVMTGRPELAMRADFRGNSSSMTAMTTSMEMSRSVRNE